MANNQLTKNYLAEAGVTAQRIAKCGANDYGVLLAAAATDALIGITTEIDALTGERCDVVHQGIADLKLGGSITRGGLVTSDATGQGVAPAPAGGSNVRVIGIALVSGVSGDVIPVLIQPGSFQG